MTINKPSQDNTVSFCSLYWGIGILALILIGLVIVPYMCYFNNAPFGNSDAWGQFGDYVSGVSNPIINIATLLFVVIGIVYSKQVYDLTRAQLDAQSTADLKQRSFSMLQLWHSEYLVNARLEAWDWYEQNAKAGPRIEAYKMRESGALPDRKNYRKHGLVWHFFVDLYHMITNNEIDNDLAKAAFFNEFNAWYEMWNRIDWHKPNSQEKKDEQIVAWHTKINELALLWGIKSSRTV